MKLVIIAGGRHANEQRRSAAGQREIRYLHLKTHDEIPTIIPVRMEELIKKNVEVMPFKLWRGPSATDGK